MCFQLPIKPRRATETTGTVHRTYSPRAISWQDLSFYSKTTFKTFLLNKMFTTSRFFSVICLSLVSNYVFQQAHPCKTYMYKCSILLVYNYTVKTNNSIFVWITNNLYSVHTSKISKAYIIIFIILLVTSKK